MFYTILNMYFTSALATSYIVFHLAELPVLNAPTEICLYGTYKITSDSTCTEHIVIHATSPEMSGIDSSLKFKLVNENILLVQWKNGDIWIKESWSRLQMCKSKSKLETPFI